MELLQVLAELLDLAQVVDQDFALGVVEAIDQGHQLVEDGVAGVLDRLQMGIDDLTSLVDIELTGLDALDHGRQVLTVSRRHLLVTRHQCFVDGIEVELLGGVEIEVLDQVGDGVVGMTVTTAMTVASEVSGEEATATKRTRRTGSEGKASRQQGEEADPQDRGEALTIGTRLGL